MSDVQQLTIWLPGPLHRRVKVVCARRGETMREVVTRLVEQWVEQIEAEQARKEEEDLAT